MSSSTTTALSRQPLVQVLRNVADPRDRRGVRHDLPTVLSLAVTGVLAGCRSLTAIWEHTTDLTGADLRSLGLEAGQALPSESTIRRVLQDLEPADLDALLRAWLCTRTGTINGRTVIAVDGKTMRGARTGEDPAPHLLAALDHATGAVLTQERVAGKSNEIPVLRRLLEPLDPGGVVVTADAMHTQADTAQWIRGRGGHYLLTVKDNQKTLRRTLKDNQKTLRRTLKALPWRDVPSISSVDTSHGRRVRRTVKALNVPKWVDFPGSAQAVQVRRTRTVKGRKRVEVVYLVCSLPMTDAQPEAVAAWVRGHWGIENRLHWIRDVVFDEDRHQLSTRNGPEIMAALRNLAISLIRLFLGPGVSIASTARSLSRRPKRAISLLTQPTP